MRFLLLFFTSVLLLQSCTEEVIVKPRAQLRLEYPKANYTTLESPCPFTFKINNESLISNKKNCELDISYPKMKATIYLNYSEINHIHKIDSLLVDAQKLTDKHTIKATSIFEQPRVDPEDQVYGMLTIINGNAATQTQFYATDSIQHFLRGSVYFNVKPNFDSLYPAIVYLRNDVKKIMETLKWK
ncbi:MAG: gliding motility lipoprotein GldD [Flavobacteriales bacterium]